MADGRVLVVVPTYNERENVHPLLRELLAQGENVDVWVADDGSPDGTADAVREVMAEHRGPGGPPAPEGEGGARGGGDRRVQEGARRSPRLHRLLRDGRRLLAPPARAARSSSPSSRPATWWWARATWRGAARRSGASGGRSCPGSPTGTSPSWPGVPIRDTTSGYRAYRRAVLEETEFDRIKIRGYVVHGEMAYQAWVHGFRLGEVPIHFKNRARAASKLSGEEIYMALLNFALLRFRYGFRPRKRPEVDASAGARRLGRGLARAGPGPAPSGGVGRLLAGRRPVAPRARGRPLPYRGGVCSEPRGSPPPPAPRGPGHGCGAACRFWTGRASASSVEWRGASLLWSAAAFLRDETAGPRCARTAEIALRLLETTGATEVDAPGLAPADALLLARASTARGVLFHGPTPASGRPLPVARPASGRGLRRAIAGVLAPSAAPPLPPPAAGAGVDAASVVALVAGSEEARDLAPLLGVLSAELGCPIVRGDARRPAAVGDAPRAPRGRGRARRSCASGSAGCGGRRASPRPTRTAGSPSPTSPRETSRRSSSGASRRRCGGWRPSRELVASAGAASVLLVVPGHDERRALIHGCSAAGVAAVVVRLDAGGGGRSGARGWRAAARRVSRLEAGRATPASWWLGCAGRAW